MLVNKEMLYRARTGRGGYTRLQVGMARMKTGRTKGVMKALVGMEVDQHWWNEFVAARIKNGKTLNGMSKPSGWEWKPTESDIPDKKIKGKKSKRIKISRKERDAFYTSPEWRDLRYRVIRKYKSACMACGRSPKLHGIVIHVDHIIPRSKCVEKSLDFNNMQLLCEDCNLGKGNKDATDWRPHDTDDGESVRA
jgi:hypothetical protein